MSKTIAERALGIFAEFQCGEYEPAPETRLVEDWGFDSLDFVEAAMEVEMEFGMPDGAAEKAATEWATVGDAIAWIEAEVAAGRAS